MKARHFLRNAAYVLLALLILPGIAVAAEVITAASFDAMAPDPQSWRLQRDMGWEDYHKNPVIDWTDKNAANPDGFSVQTSTGLVITDRKIKGALILVDYLDRKFISGQPVGSDPLSFHLFKKELQERNGGLYGEYEEELTHSPTLSVLSYDVYDRSYINLPTFWKDYLNVPNESDPSRPINHGVTIDSYWLENSYGKWGVDLEPKGVYTLPFFTFELLRYSNFQTYRDVPPSFRYVTPNQANPSQYGLNGPDAPRNGGSDGHAIEVARRGGIYGQRTAGSADVWGPLPPNLGGLSPTLTGPTDFSLYDFFFVVRAGYDESGAWQEFGQMQYPSRESIPYDLGPGPKLAEVEKFFNDYPQWIPIYAARYANGWANYQGEWLPNYHDASDANVTERIAGYNAERFWIETLAAYQADPENFVFKLPKEDWDWAAAYHGKDATEGIAGHAFAAPGLGNHDGMLDYLGMPQYRNTRYVDYTSWIAATGEWLHASFGFSGGQGYGQSGAGKSIPASFQSESDGAGRFAHEFGHVASIGDNYDGGAWSRRGNPRSDPWDIMAAADLGGPGGDHARWSVMPQEAGTVPGNAMISPRKIWRYYDEGDVLSVDIAGLVGSEPIVTNVVPRNIPFKNVYYPDLVSPAAGENYHKGIVLTFGEYADKAERKEGFSNFHSVQGGRAAQSMGVEVVERKGNDSYTNDDGVIITRSWNDSGGYSIVDAHIYDIGLTDYSIDGMDPNTFFTGNRMQLADAAFKMGKTMTDTGYYMSTRDAAGKPSAYGSEFRWEDRNGRQISGGDTVNEWRDEANGLHFYILSKDVHPGRAGTDIYGEPYTYISYQVAVRHDDGLPMGGTLTMQDVTGALTPTESGAFVRRTFRVTNNAASGDIVRITLDGSQVSGANSMTENILVDMTIRNQDIASADEAAQFVSRVVPKPFDRQNVVLMNDLFYIGANQSITFDVFVKQTGAAAPATDSASLTVNAVSETNPEKFVSNFTRSAVSSTDIRGITAPAMNQTPVFNVTATDQYDGTVVWNPVVAVGETFKVGTVYTATITLTPKNGYTFIGVPANSFTVAGATATNLHSSGVITAVFPSTGTLPAVTTTTLPAGVVGEAYSQTLAATGSTPLTWTVDNGSLPTGITLSTDGVIAGTPTRAGVYPFGVKVANAVGSAVRAFAISVTVAPVAPNITTTSLAGGTVNAGYAAVLSATGDAPITWSVTTGSLPTGLTLNTASGIISGIPTASGNVSFTVTATNEGGTDTRNLSVNIAPNIVSVTGVTLNTGSTAINVDASVPLTATVSPGNATEKSVSWSSSNTDVATVSNGRVTGVGIGTATITVTTVDGGKTASCTVSVSEVVEATKPVQLPGGGEATLPVGTEIDPDGKITLPTGQSGTVKTATGATVDVPGGSAIDGNMITLTSGGSVTSVNGPKVVVPAGVQVSGADGSMTLPSGTPGTITTSDGNVEVGVIGGVMFDSDGSVVLTNGVVSTVDETTISVPNGKVTETGTITADSKATAAGSNLVITPATDAVVTRADGSTETVSSGTVMQVWSDGSVHFEGGTEGGGSGGGCNAGYAALLALFALPLLLKKKD